MKRETTARDTLLRAEGLAALLALVGLGGAALFYPLAEVGGGTDPAQAAAPWILVGVQELLRYLPTILGGLLLPAAAWLLLGSMPWLGQGPGPALPIFRRRLGLAEVLGLLILACWVTLTAVGMAAH